MAGIDSTKVMNELQVLVLDRLQVVSYKWLSRNFSVPSNSAKRLLQEFVEHNGDGLEVVYAISGWSKAEPRCYSVRLVPKAKLEEAKAEFQDGCSVHIYSVQSCLPKDPAELWGAEFVQAEEFFNQPSGVDNCLWDNRFSAVLYPLVKRNLNGKSARIGPPVSEARPLSASAAVNGLQKQNVSLPQQELPSTSEKSVAMAPNSASEPIAALQVSVSATEVREASTGKSINASTAATNKKKGQNGKASEGTLANLWGRAASKPKPRSPSPPKPSSLPPPKPSSPPPANHVNADAQINAWETADNVSSEDEDFSRVRRIPPTNGSGRKRRVVFDMSDVEDEDDVIGSKPAVNLASPELPKQTSGAKAEFNSLQSKDADLEIKDVGRAQETEKTKADTKCKKTLSSKTTKGIQSEKPQDLIKDKVIGSDDNNKPRSGTEEKNICPSRVANNEGKVCQEHIPSNDSGMSKGVMKKRKVLKTHIDERGREVTEVAWEVDGIEPEKAKDALDPVEKSSVPGHANNKSQATAKGPSVDRSDSANPTSKPSGKHAQKGAGAGKDKRQGNILSFFKKS